MLQSYIISQWWAKIVFFDQRIEGIWNALFWPWSEQQLSFSCQSTPQNWWLLGVQRGWHLVDMQALTSDLWDQSFQSGSSCFFFLPLRNFVWQQPFILPAYSSVCICILILINSSQYNIFVKLRYISCPAAFHAITFLFSFLQPVHINVLLLLGSWLR